MLKRLESQTNLQLLSDKKNVVSNIVVNDHRLKLGQYFFRIFTLIVLSTSIFPGLESQIA
jgi:hypothetical protein